MFNSKNEFVILQDDAWFDRQKIAGKAVAESLRRFSECVGNGGVISLKDIESNCVSILKSFDCTPTFLNYKGFPGAVCLSVNEQIVHGIPSDYILKNGDVVTLDLGATFEGAIADAAFTCIFGDANPDHIRMLSLCQEALNNAIKTVSYGKRHGNIGETIFNTVKDSGFGLITNYGGHHITYDTPHSPPFISNKSLSNEGIRFCKRMALAIEPMLVMNNCSETRVLEDKWTIVSNYIGCHFEHSLYIDDDFNVHIITDHELKVKELYEN